MLGLLSAVALEADDATAARCIGALEQAGNRDAIRELVRLLASDAALHPEIVNGAAAAIERSTGRLCDPADPSAWLAWWAGVEWLPEAEWQAELAKGFRQIWLQTRQEREAYAQRAETLYRRLFSELPPEGRTALLDEMLTSPRRSVRLVGLELIERSLLNGRPVDVSLAVSTASALQDSSPEVRRLAARSLSRFAPRESRGPAIEALKIERDGPTAATLLDLVASAEPGPTACELAEKWLGEPGPAANAAARLILRAHGAGRGPGGEFDGRVRVLAAGLVRTEATPAAVRLLAALGSDEDLPLLGSLIERSDGPVLSAAVRALTTMPGGYAALASIAGATPGLRPIIADQVSRQASDLVAYEFILNLDSLPIEVLNGSLERLWGALPAASLLSAAHSTPSPSLRVTLLRERLLGEGSELPRETRRSLILLYAESLALSGSPEGVLTAVGMLERDVQASLGGELVAIALQRLHETGSPLPEPGVCAPRLWARAIELLAVSSPSTASAISDEAGIRDLIRTDDVAEALTVAAIQTLERLGDASESEDEAPVPDDVGGTESESED